MQTVYRESALDLLAQRVPHNARFQQKPARGDNWYILSIPWIAINCLKAWEKITQSNEILIRARERYLYVE